MNADVVIALITTAGLILAATVSKTDIVFSKLKSKHKDINLYNQLPKESTMRKQLLSKIDNDVRLYIEDSETKTRDPFQSILGIVFILGGVYLSAFFFNKGGYWNFGLVISGFIFLLGIAGAEQGLRKYIRDSKGNPIK